MQSPVVNPPLANTFRQALRPQRLAPILTVAAISGLVVTTYQISFGSLIFGGGLAAHLSAGIGFCLMVSC